MILDNLESHNQDGRSSAMAEQNWKSRNRRMESRLIQPYPTGPSSIDSSGLVHIFHLSVTLMPNNRPLMRLSPDEESFLRHWMYDEVHYQDGPGPAKRLQLEHRAIPADLAILIAAAIPGPVEQERAGRDRPSAEPPNWPWSEESLRARVTEARAAP